MPRPPEHRPADDRDLDDATPDYQVGVGPHPEPWPTDPHFDRELLAAGDRRNVLDRYRYWTVAAIRNDLDRRAHQQQPKQLVVAIENWVHDANIGTVVRTANAFGVRDVVLVGNKRWNRRGAMVTDRYLHLHHVPTVDAVIEWAAARQLAVVGVDNLPGSQPLERQSLPQAALMVFGQEGPGLSAEMLAAAETVVHITQYGSTRSLNAGVAAGIAMHAWIRQHGQY